MKKLFSTIVILMLLCISANAQKTFVFVVGVSNYHIPGRETVNLGFTSKDCREILDIFKQQPSTYASALTSKYATPQKIDEKFNTFFSVAKPEDKIIFHFSGHGYKEQGGGLVTVEGQPYSFDHLVSMLTKAKAGNVVCLIDACFSGLIKNAIDNYKDQLKTNLTIISGSRGTEESAESPLFGNGLLTKALKKGLRGMADADGDKVVTLMELFKFVHADVVMHNENQHPQYIGPSSTHNLVITRW